jgi:hypothetical protein
MGKPLADRLRKGQRLVAIMAPWISERARSNLRLLAGQASG